MKRRVNIVKKGNKILELFDENKRFVPFIKSATDICEDVFSKTKIGSGAQGKVYKVKFRNDRKSYIMKKTYPDFIYVSNREGLEEYIRKQIGNNISKITMKKFIHIIMEYYHLQHRVSWRKVLQFNHLSKDSIPDYDLLESFVLPIEDIDCLISESQKFDYNLNINGEIIVEAGDYVCFSNIFSETVISLIMSQLVRQGLCFHFVNFYSSVACDDGSFNYFIEKMDTSLADLIIDEDEDIDILFTPCNLFSIIVGILVMKNEYKICHNDLAFRNILVKLSSKIENIKRSKTLRYIIDDYIFDFPVPKYIYKISDFGFSQKFSHPMVLDFRLLTEDGWSMPNFDTEGIYDLYLFLVDCVTFVYMYLNEETRSIIDILLIRLFGDRNVIEKLVDGHDEDHGRFVTDMLANTTIDINVQFLVEIFGKYLSKDKNSKMIFIATDYNYNKKDGKV